MCTFSLLVNLALIYIFWGVGQGRIQGGWGGGGLRGLKHPLRVNEMHNTHFEQLHLSEVPLNLNEHAKT